MEVVIVGGGIGGLSLALFLHKAGIGSTVYEAAPEVKPLGVGISLLPHGTKALAALGLLDDVRRVAVEFKEACFFNGHGQLIYCDQSRPEWPQFLIHRAELHRVLLDAARARLGADRIVLGRRCVGAEQTANGAVAQFVDTLGGHPAGAASGDVVVACDGIHSAIRRQFYPNEGGPVFSGINIWRGVTRHPPFLSGGTHVRAGALDTGKMVIYPIRNDVDGRGLQLINWVAEIRSSTQKPVDWNRPGKLEDFYPRFANWTFEWLDVAALIRRADAVFEFPMSDRDPVPQWTFGRITLLGDAAHPMLPRGSNGAMQAILDGRALADSLAGQPSAPHALAAYEAQRLAVVNRIVLTNRSTPPDILIETVHQRTNGAPFQRLEDVLPAEELRQMLENYKRVTGADADALQRS